MTPPYPKYHLAEFPHQFRVRYPGKTILRYYNKHSERWEKLNGEQVANLCLSAAKGLAYLQIAPGDRIAIYSPNRVGCIATELGIFMMRAVLVTVAAAAVCALLSCWLIMLGWSLMGDAISHAVLPGVVLAYIAGAPFAVGAVIAALVAGGVAVGHLGVGPQGRLEPFLTLSDDSQPQPAGRVVAALRELFIQTLCLSQVTVLVLPGGGVAHQPGGGRQLQAAGNGTPHFSENSILTHDGRPYFSMNITRIKSCAC